MPAPWANDGYDNRVAGGPSSTYSEWTYDDPCGVYSFDTPENSWFVSHPHKVDPEPIDPCLPYFSVQQWGGYDDPCAADWFDELPGGRIGGITFGYGSWDINNFFDVFGDPLPGLLPKKDLWIQATYFTGGGAADWSYELTGISQSTEGQEDVFLTGDLVPVFEPIQLPNGWWHTVFAFSAPSAGYLISESLSLYPDQVVLLDQVIIETLQEAGYIPEPATMVLFGVSGLLMIRRKKSTKDRSRL